VTANLRNALFAATVLLTVVLGVLLLVIGPQNFDDDEATMSEVAAQVIRPAFWILLGVSSIWALAIFASYITRRRRSISGS
jgi:hypothetical protein